MAAVVGAAVTAFENSDVLPKVLQAAPSVHAVAVAVITSPTLPAKVWLKESDPPPGWGKLVAPARTSPSPLPLPSGPDGFLKSSIRYEPAGTSRLKSTFSPPANGYAAV